MVCRCVRLCCLTVIGFWQFRHADFYDNPHALDLAVVAAAMVGGIIGFLWWNAAPAQIFMGDTGSLVGSGLAALALTTSTHLLLPIIGGLFVMETVSVILQIVCSVVLTGNGSSGWRRSTTISNSQAGPRPP